MKHSRLGFFYYKGQKGRRSKKTWRIGLSNCNLRNVNMFSIGFLFFCTINVNAVLRRSAAFYWGSGLSFDTKIRPARPRVESESSTSLQSTGEMKESREESAVQRWSCQRTLVSRHKERTCLFTLGRHVKNKKEPQFKPLSTSTHQLSVMRRLCKK